MSKKIDALLASKAFQEIEKHVIEDNKSKHRLNVFSLLDEFISENVLSSFLSALLTSTERHGLNTGLVESIFDFILNEQPNVDVITPLIGSEYIRSKAYTEWVTPVLQRRRIDIIVELRSVTNELVGVIGVELKIHATEQSDQVSDYQKAIEIAFGGIPKLMLFLTPNKRVAITKSDSILCPVIEMGYNDLADCLKKLENKLELSADFAVLLISFQNYLRSFVHSLYMKELEKKRIEDIFLDKDKRATIKFIYENFPTINDLFFNIKAKLMKLGVEENEVHFFKQQEIKIFLGYDDEYEYEVCLMLHCDRHVPTIESEFVLKVMLLVPELTTRNTYRNHIDKLILPNSTGKLTHWWNWINVWVGTSIILEDVGEKDANKIADLMFNYIMNNKSKIIARLKENASTIHSI